MIYEGTIQYIAIDSNGNDKSTKANYIIENAELFAQVESKLYEEFKGYTDIDVVAVKRSKIKEIINTRQNDDDLIWMAELQDTFVGDDGKEKTSNIRLFYTPRHLTPQRLSSATTSSRDITLLS